MIRLSFDLVGQLGSSAYFRIGVVDKEGNTTELRDEQPLQFRWTYLFGPEFDKVKVDYYATTEKAVIPIDLQVSLGL